MKGFIKSAQRAPHMLTSRVGMAKKSNDPEFDDYERKFKVIETACEKLVKDSKVFRDAVLSLLVSGDQFAAAFSSLFTPIGGEYDLIGKNPQAEATIQNIGLYRGLMEELRTALSPEIELIDARVVGPGKELQEILKKIRKTITKREHKLTDYDRHNNSYSKLRDKKEKSLSDEKNLFKYEQDFEAASAEYEHYNTLCKTELPQFLQLSTRFIDPLFHSFYFMQLNIFYLMLEKIQSFSDGKYELSHDLSETYDAAIGDTAERVEALQIVQRQVSTAKLMAGHPSGFGRASSVSSRTPPVRAPSSSSSAFEKSVAAPPPSRTVAAPPAYTPGGSVAEYEGVAAAQSTKRPPPPPPLKAKPSFSAPSPVKYVVALFDFEAQAAGDLSFSTGDRIELVERTGNTEDWWTGRLDGRQGVFPGNYVQEE